MGNNLIAAQEIVAIAFTDDDQITPSAIQSHKIEAAELRFIEPYINELYPKLREGAHKEFVNQYIKPPLAYFVKYAMIAELMIKIGNNGITRNKNKNSDNASSDDFDIIRAETRNIAMALIKKAVIFLENNTKTFPEYDPTKNISRRVSINGGLIL